MTRSLGKCTKNSDLAQNIGVEYMQFEGMDGNCSETVLEVFGSFLDLRCVF